MRLVDRLKPIAESNCYRRNQTSDMTYLKIEKLLIENAKVGKDYCEISIPSKYLSEMQHRFKEQGYDILEFRDNDEEKYVVVQPTIPNNIEPKEFTKRK